MDEDLMHRILMLASMVLSVLAGIGTITLLIMSAMDFTVPMAVGTFLMAVTTIGFGLAAVYFGREVTGHPLIFTNEAEREVLTVKQRRELRRKRGEVVMDRALVEIEQERDNIVHRAIEAANDPSKPPHETKWTKGSSPKSMPYKKDWEE